MLVPFSLWDEKMQTQKWFLFALGLLPLWAAAQNFDIAAGSVGEVLEKFAQQAQIDYFVEDSDAAKKSAGVKGDLSISAALAQILQQAQLSAQEQIDGSFLISAANNNTKAGNLALDTVVISAENVDIDRAGYFDIYDQDQSTAFVGKAQIERFKGKDAGDIFQGMLNIYSADARNGGGIDPNIRGVQGPGRVPVSIDDTEQAVTINRGYRGISNRNYIDPNLIGRIKVIKGPAIDPFNHTSSGGGVAMQTINAHDVVKKGQDYGAELIIETSNSATKPRLPTLATGVDYRAVFPDGAQPESYNEDPTLMKKMYKKGDENPLSVDTSYRFAAGLIKPKFEVLAALAQRTRGNYFSGEHDYDFYKSYQGRDKFNSRLSTPNSLAYRQQPGFEVPNTSSKNQSILLKTKFKPQNGQVINFGYRHTKSEYGEIMASRAGALINGKLAQWPLSTVNLDAYNLGYQFKSVHNPLLDLDATWWRTDTKSNTYSSGGAPNYANNIQHVNDYLDGKDMFSYPAGTFIFSPILRNTAVASNNEYRYGINIKNDMQFNDQFKMSAFARFQYHKLGADNHFPAYWDGWRQMPRAGRRQETELGFTAAYHITDKLTVSGGLKYGTYWLYDDLLADLVAMRMPNLAVAGRDLGVYMQYKLTQPLSDAELQTNKQNAEQNYEAQVQQCNGQSAGGVCPQSKKTEFAQERDKKINQRQKQVTIVDQPWYHHDGYYSRDNNPCIAAIKKYGKDYVKGSCAVQDGTMAPGQKYNRNIAGSRDLIAVKKVKDKDWMPAIAVRYQFNDAYRVYARYTESKRFPSMFEGTIGFSANVSRYAQIRPEHVQNYEIGTVYSFKNGDVRLSYFHHYTKDIMERLGLIGNANLSIQNFDSQTLSGLEFQGRFDNGSYFAELNYAYNLTNKLCDENTTALIYLEDYQRGNCTSAGMDAQSGGLFGISNVGNGYLQATAIPPYTANLTFGGRFLQRKIESGMRVNLTAAQNNQNSATNRERTVIADWYLNYDYNDNIGIEAVINNVMDKYYIDALARSDIPAPGRTLKLKLGVKF